MILKYRVKPSFMHTKMPPKTTLLYKKSSFQLSKWRALTSMLVIYQVNLLVTFMKKKNSHFCLEARG